MNILELYNKNQIDKVTKDVKIPGFKAGDTLKVHVKIVEGATERVQIFEGLCISKRNRSIGSTFIVRKISYGNEGVERIFHLYSPRIAKIEVVKCGKVRRAKLYYLRKLQGKASRIAEKVDYASIKLKKNKGKVAILPLDTAQEVSESDKV